MSLLLALCGEKDNILVKEVPLNEATQRDVNDVFKEQEASFREGNEVPFDQNWTSENDEILTVGIPQGVTVFKEIFETIATSFEPIDTNNFASEDIRALAIKDKKRILVQAFRAGQSLSHKRFSLLYRDGTFTRLKESAFHLDNKLVCIIENGLIKFRSLHNLGCIIDTSTIFNEATDAEVNAFVKNNAKLFSISDHAAFIERHQPKHTEIHQFNSRQWRLEKTYGQNNLHCSEENRS